VKLIDVFMAFLVVVGGLQFLYCVIVGNYVSFCFALGWRGDPGTGQGLFADIWGGGGVAFQCLSRGI